MVTKSKEFLVSNTCILLLKVYTSELLHIPHSPIHHPHHVQEQLELCYQVVEVKQKDCGTTSYQLN